MLLVIFGPPAVGKMTVGRAVCANSDFRLFHNHMTIEPLAQIFDYGTPAFMALNDEFRFRVLDEAARHDVDLVFTFVWGLELEDDLRVVERCVAPFEGDVAFVELRADLDTRLERNRTDLRLEEKRSKRNLAWSDRNVRDFEMYTMTTAHGASVGSSILARYPHLALDNTEMSPEQVAGVIHDWLSRLAP